MKKYDAALDNALVRQKDKILILINAGLTDLAKALLLHDKEIWEACDYGYKYDELVARIKDKENKPG